MKKNYELLKKALSNPLAVERELQRRRMIASTQSEIDNMLEEIGSLTHKIRRFVFSLSSYEYNNLTPMIPEDHERAVLHCNDMIQIVKSFADILESLQEPQDNNRKTEKEQ